MLFPLDLVHFIQDTARTLLVNEMLDMSNKSVFAGLTSLVVQICWMCRTDEENDMGVTHLSDPRTMRSTTYCTSDLYDSCYLLTLPDVRLSGIRWHGQRAEFEFEADPSVDIGSELLAVRNGTATVAVRDYVNAIKALKSELYGARR
jgi:hypothetical protein